MLVFHDDSEDMRDSSYTFAISIIGGVGKQFAVVFNGQLIFGSCRGDEPLPSITRNTLAVDSELLVSQSNSKTLLENMNNSLRDSQVKAHDILEGFDREIVIWLIEYGVKGFLDPYA